MPKFATRAEHKKLDRQVRDALRLASTHDPDFLNLFRKIYRRLRDAESRLDVCERRLDRLGAPQYRTVRKGSGGTRKDIDLEINAGMYGHKAA